MRGIVHKVMTSHSPESNERAKWLNETLLNATTTMLIDATNSAKKRLWAEVVNTGRIVMNRLLTSRIVE